MKRINHPDELPATDLAMLISKLRKSGQTWDDIDNFKNTHIANTVDALDSIGYELKFTDNKITGVKRKDDNQWK